MGWEAGQTPRINHDNIELVVRGRVVDQVNLTSVNTLIQNKKWEFQLLGLSVWNGFNSYPEVPRKGDLVCALQGCPTFIYLRPTSNHFVVIGRNQNWQQWIKTGKFLDPSLEESKDWPKNHGIEASKHAQRGHSISSRNKIAPG